MDRLSKYLYFSDGAENEVETLFILESPYKEELLWEYPCMGKTGAKMSEILIHNSSVALGILIQHNSSLTRKYALFETFKFPLDKSLKHGLDAEELFWQKIKMKSKRLQIEEFFRQNRSYFDSSYRCNLECGIRLFQRTLKTIVVCGNIAQVIFEEIFKEKFVQLGRSIKRGVKTFDVVYAEHPARAAYTHRRWNYQPNAPVKFNFLL